MLELDGRNDYISFGSDSALSSADTLSVSLWIRPDDSRGFMRVLGKFQSSANQCEFAVFLFGGRVGVALSLDGSPCGGDVVPAMTWAQINGADQTVVVPPTPPAPSLTPPTPPNPTASPPSTSSPNAMPEASSPAPAASPPIPTAPSSNA